MFGQSKIPEKGAKQMTGPLSVRLADPCDWPAAEAMLRDARALQQAGADMLILECIPSGLAARMQQALAIPVIGIGAGADCDGQVLVITDVLGLSDQPPRFALDYAKSHGAPRQAIAAFIADVRAGRFPQAAQCFS